MRPAFLVRGFLPWIDADRHAAVVDSWAIARVLADASGLVFVDLGRVQKA